MIFEMTLPRVLKDGLGVVAPPAFRASGDRISAGGVHVDFRRDSVLVERVSDSNVNWPVWSEHTTLSEMVNYDMGMPLRLDVKYSDGREREYSLELWYSSIVVRDDSFGQVGVITDEDGVNENGWTLKGDSERVFFRVLDVSYDWPDGCMTLEDCAERMTRELMDGFGDQLKAIVYYFGGATEPKEIRVVIDREALV